MYPGLFSMNEGIGVGSRSEKITIKSPLRNGIEYKTIQDISDKISLFFASIGRDFFN